MKRFFTLLAIFALSLPAFAQDNLNMTLRSNVQYNPDLSDVWGWTSQDDGTEYAIVGLRDAVSIVSLADLDNAVEVARISGPSSTWRDIQTWGNFAYVSNETGSGILVIDMSKLPAEAPFEYWAPDIPEIGGTISSVHNLFIDEKGILYVAGANINNGGVIFADVATNPGKPEVIGWNEAVYSHDVYVRDGIAYDAQISDGRMAIYDWNDPMNPTLLATQVTPFAFTHNTWLSDNSEVVFTTDERANAPVAAYDVSDLDDIKFLDEYRPIGTVGKNVIPHNVHVWSDWLLISYYTDGGRVVDASRPSNLIEVASFDTWLNSDGGFDGAWGLYPYFPSGTILVSDIGNGLYVLTPNLVRACWLEGNVTEKGTGTALNEVQVIIDIDQDNLGVTNTDGRFESGIATAGTYDVTFTKPGYLPLTISVDLNNGELTEINVEMEPLSKYVISGKVIKASDGSGVPNAQVRVANDDFTFDFEADASGNYTLETFEGTYEIIAGAWGYVYGSEMADLNSNIVSTVELEVGYRDDFVFDYGWVAGSDGAASTGFWERANPVGTAAGGNTFANPNMDVAFDLGIECYVTGNGGGNIGTDDIDGGAVTLTTPPMDLTSYDEPAVSVFHWFFNIDRGGTPRNDTLMISASNGTDNVVILKTADFAPNWSSAVFNLKDYLSITDNMTVTFTAADNNPGHVTEAAIDAFKIIEGTPTSNENILLTAKMEAFPNPFGENMTFEYDLEETGAVLTVKNILGQTVETRILSDNSGTVTLGSNWQAGVYFAKISKGEKDSEVLKLIKQ